MATAENQVRTDILPPAKHCEGARSLWLQDKKQWFQGRRFFGIWQVSAVLWEESLCRGKALLGLTCAGLVLAQSSLVVVSIRNMRELAGHKMNDINLTDVSK